MKLTRYALVLFVFISYKNIFGQVANDCASWDVHEQCLENEDSYAISYSEMNNIIYNITLQQLNSLTSNQYTIPVVFHIIHAPNETIGNGTNISDEQVYQCMDYINDAFSNTGSFFDPLGFEIGINFCLAQYDPDGTPTNGINRIASATYNNLTLPAEEPAIKTNTAQWNPYFYLNIYVVNNICSGTNCDIAGYAYPANAHGTIYDGVVIKSNYIGESFNNTKTLIHELGHYFNLLHPFENGCTNNDCLADNDRVCDTPPDNSNAFHACTSAPNSCSTDEDDLNFYNPFRPISMGGLGDQPDMIENYMDYGYNSCKSLFTEGQRQRMLITVEEFRSSLLANTPCFAPPSSISCTQPENVQATNVQTNQVTLSWNNVIGAVNYNCQFKEINASQWLVQNSNDNSIIFNGLQPNTVYQFKVSANCYYDTSPDSQTITFTTDSEGEFCEIPTNVQAYNVLSNQISISWNEVATATTYQFQFREESQNWSEPTNYSQTSLVFSGGIAAGNTYLFRVKAICGNIESEYSETISITITQTCAVPANVTATNVNESSAFISWTSVSGASSYTISYKTQSASNWTTTTSTVSSKTLSNLQSGTSYLVRVKTNCQNQSSTYSAITGFTTTQVQQIDCLPPASLWVNNITQTNATINWQVSATANNYFVHYKKTTDANYQTQFVNGTSSILNNLLPNTQYTVAISSNCNNNISSDLSSVFNFTTLQELPPVETCETPQQISITNITSNSATISWSGNDNDTNYKLYYKLSSDAEYQNVTTSNTTFTLTNLQAFAYHQVKVQAICGNENSQLSAPYYFTTLQSIPEPESCLAPDIIEVDDVTETSATISWNVVDEAGFYTIKYRPETQGDYIFASATTNSINLNNLQSGTTYELAISSMCGNFVTEYSNPVFFTTEEEENQIICNTPTNIQFSNITEQQTTATWDVALNAIAYEIGYMKITNNQFENFVTATNSFTFNNLQAGTTYNVRVKSLCGNGIESDYSYIFTFTTEEETVIETCEQIENLSPSSIGINDATIVWSGVQNATQYIVLCKPQGGNWEIKYVNNTYVNIPNLQANTTYYVKVNTICGALVSGYAPTINFTTLQDETPPPPPEPPVSNCPTPTNIQLDYVDASSCMLSWQSDANSNFYIATLYTSQNEDDYIIEKGAFAPFIQFTNLSEATNYWVRIRGNCNGEMSNYSAWFNFSTDGFVEVCEPPTNLTASNETEYSADLSWSFNDEANSYNVEITELNTNSTNMLNVGSNSIQATGLSECSNYSWKVQANCNGNVSEFSSTHYFDTECIEEPNPPVDGEICEAQAQSTEQGYIKQIKIGNSINVSGDNNGYADYSDIAITLKQTGSNIFILKSSNATEQYYWGIWVDANIDGYFEVETEKLYCSDGPKAGTVGGFITLNNMNIAEGATLRILMSKQPLTNACNSIELGEIEDYSVTIN